MSEVYELKKQDFPYLTVEDNDDVFLTIHFFNIKLNVKKDLFFEAKVLYFVVSDKVVDGKVRGTVSCLSKLPFNYNLCEKRNLLEFNEEQLLGGNTMLDGFKIADVVLGEINDVALEVAVEGMAKNLDGVTIKKKGTATYLVKDGNTIELNGEQFKTMVANYIKGKTVSELRSNTSMYTLITKLGLVQKITLEKEAGDLSAIFG